MAYGKPEQICRCIESLKEYLRESSGYRKVLKKTATRRRRMLEKILVGNTPTKNEYYGWSL